MLSQEIRVKFLEYFKNKGHTIVPFSAVIPHDDPTLLFTNAGMNQFKDVFLGSSQRDYTTATTSQKCIRVGGKHNDLDNVGHTTRHMTFFEMLGNFSFGDYFKEDAIAFANEVTLNVYGFEKENVWATVYEEDEDSFNLWAKYLPKDRIIKMGKKDNFWTMGETGPCGPCSELFYDCGQHLSSAKNPKEDPEGVRFLEFWNLVFMEFDLHKSGKISPLPRKGVDTGSGLERVVAILDKTFNVFHIDIFQKIIGKISEVLGTPYDKQDLQKASAFHVIADHLRSLSFAIADGAQPSNIERGYVLRKVLRRAIRYAKTLGAEKPFLAEVVPTLIEVMGEDFDELKSSEKRICEIITVEEESFFKTLRRGGNILSSIIEKAKASNKNEISGDDAFKLKDTYGFPLEEIVLIAKDYHLQVNLEAFAILEIKAKELSKKARDVLSEEVKESLFDGFVEKYDPCEFVGYTEDESEATITAIVKNGKFVDTLNEGEEALVVLDKTPFYAEKGGQVSNIGKLSHNSANFVVAHTKSPLPSVIVHQGKLESGTIITGEPVTAKIDMERRELIENNHSATHLLHWALQIVLGEHIKQAGSLVDPTKLRFDFNHHKGVTQEQLREVEKLVNAQIRINHPIKSYEISLESVQKKKEIKQFFGDKYGSVVRVVDIADFSKELCGGTHVQNLGKLGLFKIVKEGSIAQGVRRIEAVTAEKAELIVENTENRLYEIANTLSTPLVKLEESLQNLISENASLKTELKTLKSMQLNELKSSLGEKISTKGDLRILSIEIDIDPKELFPFANGLFSEKNLSILLIAVKSDSKCQILVKLDDKAQALGLNAKDIIKEISPFINGGGGGKADSAQAGGTNPEGLSQAISKFTDLIEEKC